MANNVTGDYFGSLATIYIANYSDIKMHQLSHEIKNSNIIKAMAIAASIFFTGGKGRFLGDAVRGSGSWAVGSLLEPYIQSHISHTGFVSNTSVTVTPTNTSVSA